MQDDGLDQLKNKIAKSLCKILYEESAALDKEKQITCNVYAPHDKILFTGEPSTATATVTYITVCPTEKKHTVNIKFKYDKAGKFIRSSMTYV